ncbi:MAG: YfhO family protein, partial [Desulfosalsimonadaceae bacterium]|nr:YfhO family protein [Desulfosalsimonadaceae bacterium]
MNGFCLFFILVLVVQLFVFKDFVIFDKLLIFLDAGCDSYNLFYPEFVHSARYIRTEGIPTWSFSEGMGQSIFPGGISNPFFWPLNLFGTDRLAYGIVFIELLKSMTTGIFFYFFLKILNFSKFTCIAGGVLASFLGYLILGSSGWYGHSTNVVYFILLLYAFELFYQKNNWLLFPFAVLLVAANPFRLYLYTVFLFTYALLKILSEHEPDVKGAILFLFKLAGAGAIGVGMSTVFSFNDLLAMINSPRVSGDVQARAGLLSTSVFSVVDPLQGVTSIMRLFSNDLMGTGSGYTGYQNYLEAPIFYAGLLPLLLVTQVFVLPDKRKRAFSSLFLLLWMVPLVFPFFRFALYAFMGDYYKHGLSMFVPFTVLLFGLYGFENIQKRSPINDIVLFGTLIVLLGLLHFPYFNGTPLSEQIMIRPDL